METTALNEQLVVLEIGLSDDIADAARHWGYYYIFDAIVSKHIDTPDLNAQNLYSYMYNRAALEKHLKTIGFSK